jgi:hypothetical protein
MDARAMQLTKQLVKVVAAVQPVNVLFPTDAKELQLRKQLVKFVAVLLMNVLFPTETKAVQPLKQLIKFDDLLLANRLFPTKVKAVHPEKHLEKSVDPPDIIVPFSGTLTKLVQLVKLQRLKNPLKVSGVPQFSMAVIFNSLPPA